MGPTKRLTFSRGPKGCHETSTKLDYQQQCQLVLDPYAKTARRKLHREPCICLDETSLLSEPLPQIQVSHEKNPGWLGFIGDYTIQLYGDYNKLL